MKLPEFGVTRPIATSMLFVMVLVLGVILIQLVLIRFFRKEDA